MLDNPSYMQELPADHALKRNENVFPFSQNLASLEVFHLIALATAAAGQNEFGVQRFRWLPGIVDFDVSRKCHESCRIDSLVANGDTHFSLCGRDIGAERARAAAKEPGPPFLN